MEIKRLKKDLKEDLVWLFRLYHSLKAKATNLASAYAKGFLLEMEGMGPNGHTISRGGSRMLDASRYQGIKKFSIAIDNLIY